MKNLKIKQVRCGYYYIMDGNEQVGTMERSEDGYAPYEEHWFATRFPSHADCMANQWDRWPQVCAHGRTMSECLKNFASKY